MTTTVTEECRKFVRRAFPMAAVHRHQPIPRGKPEFTIVDFGGEDFTHSHELSDARPTEEEAWAEAARRIKEAK